MPKLTVSEMYASAAVITLLIAAVLNIPAFTLGVALLGLAVGLFLLRRDQPLTRAGLLALMGFAVAGIFALYSLVS
jgi:hypothetical protein